jgi:heme exporter protein CcmD
MSAGFWSMGGYARFVWPCFGVAFAVLIWNVLSARRFLAASQLRTARALAVSAIERSEGGELR